MTYKPVPEVDEEYESHSQDESSQSHQQVEPLMFIDIALQQNQKPIRIALYEDSDPHKIALKFIKQQGIDSNIYYEELVTMMIQAKEKAQQERHSPAK